MKIMKKNILFGVVCVALLTATSCSDFLDVQPEGDARDNAYFGTVANIRGLFL